MKWVTRDSVLNCGHDGVVRCVARQDWVRIQAPVQVEADPVGRTIVGCPNVGPTIKPCTTTLRVVAGYSGWLRIDGRPVVLSHLDGLTDGTPPGTVHYRVSAVRQDFVRADR